MRKDEEINQKLGWIIVEKNIKVDTKAFKKIAEWERKGYDTLYTNGTLSVRKRKFSLKGSKNPLNNSIKIPMNPLSAKQKTIANILWLIYLPLLISSIFISNFGFIFFLVIGAYELLLCHSNVINAFKNHLKSGLLFVPILFAIDRIGEYLIRISGISILNTVISFNFLFGSSSGEIPETNILTMLFSIGLLLFLCLGLNYMEEFYFRKRWFLVPIWCLLHLVLGFSTFTLGNFMILCIAGVIFKLIYDKYSVQTSYISHFFFNVANVLYAVLPLPILAIFHG